MVDLLTTVTKEMQGITHEDFHLESSLRESPVVIPEPVLRLSPAFAEWLRCSAAYDADVTARNPSAEPDDEGIKPLSRFTLKIFGCNALVLLYRSAKLHRVTVLTRYASADLTEFCLPMRIPLFDTTSGRFQELLQRTNQLRDLSSHDLSVL